MNTFKPKYTLQEISDLVESGEIQFFTDEEIQKVTDDINHTSHIFAKNFGEEWADNRKSDHESNKFYMAAHAPYVEMVRKKFPHHADINILDIGAGSGNHAEVLSLFENVSVSVLEPAEFFFNNCLLPLKEKGVVKNALHCGVENMSSCEDASYEGVFCNAVLHRLMWIKNRPFELEQAISEISRILKLGGIAKISTLAKSDRCKTFVCGETNRLFYRVDESEFAEILVHYDLKVISSEITNVYGPMGCETPWLDVYAQKI